MYARAHHARYHRTDAMSAHKMRTHAPLWVVAHASQSDARASLRACAQRRSPARYWKVHYTYYFFLLGRPRQVYNMRHTNDHIRQTVNETLFFTFRHNNCTKMERKRVGSIFLHFQTACSTSQFCTNFTPLILFSGTKMIQRTHRIYIFLAFLKTLSLFVATSEYLSGFYFNNREKDMKKVVKTWTR